jgi:hypothetical protein
MPTFRLANETKPLKGRPKKLVEKMGQAPSFGDKSQFGERLGHSLRSRTPKPDAQKPAAVGLFSGLENRGETLWRRRLEQR